MPLKVIILGAGLGGLAAAVALNRAGHDVEVFEKSSFHNEVGAAIHVAPNASRLLKGWDCDIDALQPVHCKHLDLRKASGEYITTFADTEKLQKELNVEDPWLLVHRVDLHNALHKMADTEYQGRKPRIHLSSPVASVDHGKGEVVLSDGTRHPCDLIVGADGVHTVSAPKVTEDTKTKISTGQNCYRFLVPMEKLNANPITRKFIEEIDGLNSLVAFAGDNHTRVVLYPCRSGEIMNCASFVPSHGEDPGDDSWHNSGHLEDLEDAVKGYCEGVRTLVSLGEDVNFWSLASRDPPRSFVNEKLVLVGDAAHPMLPHQGQGGAQAFEDAAALAAALPANCSAQDLATSLAVYNDVRYARAVTVMFMSRVANEKRDETLGNLSKFIPDAELPTDMFAYTWVSRPDDDVVARLT